MKMPINFIIEEPNQILVNFLKDNIFGTSAPFNLSNQCEFLCTTRITDIEKPDGKKWLELHRNLFSLETSREKKAILETPLLNLFNTKENITEEVQAWIQYVHKNIGPQKDNFATYKNLRYGTKIAFANKLDIKSSDWEFRYGLDGLFKLLKNNGPFIAKGFYGSNFYLAPPIDQGKVWQGIKILQFPKGTFVASPNIHCGGSRHAIMVVGLEKIPPQRLGEPSKGIIYYVDPGYKIEKNLQDDCMFIMSSELFFKHMANISAISPGTMDGEERSDLAFPPFFEIAKDFGLLQKVLGRTIRPL